MRVVAGEDGGAGGPAAGGVVEVGEAESVFGKGIKVRGGNFGTVATEVRVAEIVREDEKDVGFFCGQCRGPKN